MIFRRDLRHGDRLRPCRRGVGEVADDTEADVADEHPQLNIAAFGALYRFRIAEALRNRWTARPQDTVGVVLRLASLG